MSTGERYSAVRALLARNLSRRAIARKFGCSEGSIRQLLELDSLPAAARRQALAGRPLAPLLERARRDRELGERKRRLSEEQAAGGPSDRLASAIVGWLSQMIARPYSRQAAAEAERLADGFGRHAMPIVSLEQVLRDMAPPHRGDGPELVAELAERLAAAVVAAEPEPAIRLVALRKAVERL